MLSPLVNLVVSGDVAEEAGLFPGAVRRLCRGTRCLASRVMRGSYGRMMVGAGGPLSECDASACPELHAAKAVLQLAETAPLRVVAGELLVGAAPYLEAANHRKPIAGVSGTSHTTIGFEKVLKEGLIGLEARVRERRSGADLTPRQTTFLEAMLLCVQAMRCWHERQLAELARRAESVCGAERMLFQQVHDHLAPVPWQAPQTFRQAVQGLWFLWEFQRLCGNWSGVGRIDKMLGPYLQADLAAGELCLDDARELLAHFWIKGAEWTGAETGHVGTSGDAQFYQNIVLGGVDEDGVPVYNEVTELVLDIVEELHISDFPVAVRVNQHMPDHLWTRIAAIQRLGGGIVSIYNDDLIIDSLVDFGYPLADARDFANDGCWEVMVPGKTAFSYRPFDMLLAFQDAVGLTDGSADPPCFQSFEQVYSAFLDSLRRQLDAIREEIAGAFQQGPPSPLLSLFVEDCVQRAMPYHSRGARYSVRSPHAGGVPDTANSLSALKRVVFDEQRLGFREFIEVLRANWEGHETLREEIRRDVTCYGNDDDVADEMLQRVCRDYIGICRETPVVNGVLMPPGISTFGRELAFREQRTAQPFGAKAGNVLASNLSPTPGTDRRGPTAVVNSFCKIDLSRLTCGTPLDLKMHPSCVANEAGLAALSGLLRRFVQGGGLYLQVDVVDSEVLRDAQVHPERYPNLSVRISGWSARFVTLSREWQEMIIQRTEQQWQQ